MNYLSIQFLILLAVTLLLFYLWPKKYLKYRYFLFLVASYVFISFYDWRCGLIVLGNTLVSYSCGLFTHGTKTKKTSLETSKSDVEVIDFKDMEKVETQEIRRTWLMVLSIVINIGLLFVVKYFNWIGGALSSLFEQPFSAISFIVPLGISFYIFTLVAYNVDVWKKKFPAEKNFFKFAAFVSFFPKLAEGPIISYDEVASENSLFNEHTFEDIDILKHFQRIILGIIKKVLIADIIGIYVSYIWANWSTVPGWYFALSALLYAIQLYCDFSGFMDMSLGVAGLLGVELPENFNTPYLSKTVQEFWNKWHISLGKWLKNYIYIPSGGNRVKKSRWIFNILLVWMISGLWHGAEWTFIIWGLYYGLILVISGLLRPFNKKVFEKYQSPVATALRVIRTFALVTIGWSIFSAPDLMTYLRFGKRFLLHMFDGSAMAMFNSTTLPIGYFIFALIMVSLLIAYYYLSNVKNLINKLIPKQWIKNAIGFVINAGVLVSAIYVMTMIGGLGVTTSGFLYFEF